VCKSVPARCGHQQTVFYGNRFSEPRKDISVALLRILQSYEWTLAELFTSVNYSYKEPETELISLWKNKMSGSQGIFQVESKIENKFDVDNFSFLEKQS
jgi:hypothetical protein